MDAPETRYTKSGDVHVAYQVFGDGDLDLVSLAEFWNSIEAMWEQSDYRHFLERLGSFARVICMDQRRTGSSDPVSLSNMPTLEEWIEKELEFGWGRGVLLETVGPNVAGDPAFRSWWARYQRPGSSPGTVIRGIAVHTGARVAAEAAPGEVLVSSTVRDLAAGSGIAFADRGLHALRGVPEPWHLFTVVAA